MAHLAPNAAAQASVELKLEAPEALVLVGPANLGNTNLNRATIVVRDLDDAWLSHLIEPIVRKTLAQCNAPDVRAINLRAAKSPDRIGGTTGRYGGLGIYANLPSNDRNSGGNWFIAPFLFFEGTLTTSSGATESFELFELDRIFIETGRTTQEEFFRSRTSDVETALSGFVANNLPKALSTALGKHCHGS